MPKKKKKKKKINSYNIGGKKEKENPKESTKQAKT